jgi:hypothetical protein
MATYQFGAVGATNIAEGTYGFLQNFSTSYSSDEATAQNAAGDVAAQTIFNEVTEVTCEYVYDTTTSLPVIGATITVGATDKYTVMSVEETESNTEYTRASITMKRYTAVGIPTNS